MLTHGKELENGRYSHYNKHPISVKHISMKRNNIGSRKKVLLRASKDKQTKIFKLTL